MKENILIIGGGAAGMEAATQLQKLGLIAAVGRKDVIGKPMLYATTDTFLHKFGLHNLSELPTLPLEEIGVLETV